MTKEQEWSVHTNTVKLLRFSVGQNQRSAPSPRRCRHQWKFQLKWNGFSFHSLIPVFVGNGAGKHTPPVPWCKYCSGGGVLSNIWPAIHSWWYEQVPKWNCNQRKAQTECFCAYWIHHHHFACVPSNDWKWKKKSNDQSLTLFLSKYDVWALV